MATTATTPIAAPPIPLEVRQDMIESLSLALAGLRLPTGGFTRWLDRMETPR